jgi:carbon monoxide dehydrogenase subunit G
VMPAAKLHYRIERTSAATPQQIYDVLLDVERWPQWMPGVRTAGWERRGASGSGVGGIRRFGAPGMSAREEIVAGEPARHQSYTALSGLPVKDYRADVYLDERPGGSQITWEATFDSRIPLVGKVLQRIMRSTIGRAADALAKEAERRAKRGA